MRPTQIVYSISAPPLPHTKKTAITHTGLSIDPLYISEVAPPSHRGHLVSFSEIAINVGILLGVRPVY